jgi:hypothetical protein
MQVGIELGVDLLTQLPVSRRLPSSLFTWASPTFPTATIAIAAAHSVFIVGSPSC